MHEKALRVVLPPPHANVITKIREIPKVKLCLLCSMSSLSYSSKDSLKKFLTLWILLTGNLELKK